jgi:hypothetical protein
MKLFPAWKHSVATPGPFAVGNILLDRRVNSLSDSAEDPFCQPSAANIPSNRTQSTRQTMSTLRHHDEKFSQDKTGMDPGTDFFEGESCGTGTFGIGMQAGGDETARCRETSP